MVVVDNNFDYYKDKERITNSMLGWLKVSSGYFKKMFDEYPNEDLEDDQYMEFGNAFHCTILEPKEFNIRYSIIDEPAPTNIVQKKFINTLMSSKKPLDDDYSIDDIIEVYEQEYSVKGKSKEFIRKAAFELYNKTRSYIKYLQNAANKKAITQDNVDRIEKMRKSIINHDIAKTLIFDKYLDIDWHSENEKTLFFTMTIDNELIGVQSVEMKCKVDRIIWNPKTKEIIIIDLKTNSLKTTRKNYISQLIADVVEEFDYDRQAALYREAVKQNLGEFFSDTNDVVIKNYIVACQTNVVYETRVLNLTEKTIIAGLTKAIVLLNDYVLNRQFGFDHDSIYYYNKVISV